MTAALKLNIGILSDKERMKKNRFNLLFIIILIMIFSSAQNLLTKDQQQKNQSLIILNGKFVDRVWMSGRIIIHPETLYSLYREIKQ